jgi:hypothetical protein
MSVQVSLDLTRWAHACLIRILTRLAQCAALTEEVPALIELNLHCAQPTMFFGFVDLAMLQLLAERLLLGDELIHFGENVTVTVHQSSVPDYGVDRGWRYE